ncbi:tRNA N(3)-methylcytidine methyltransferase METTL2 [Sesamum angolense]|uniref:tRNA N(3)-methylcytidine methyltransferase METTL2 n=1 Tax=Sesamum angolense TaxID=2727404 RepID=A0AAE2C089_9LAMI|nr:tRNA N(3)-methylcytidine methyltransferase METTL2 [Sesamum angolense]
MEIAICPKVAIVPKSQRQNIDNLNNDAEQDSEAWDEFHARHSTGKFFKVKLIVQVAERNDEKNVLDVGFWCVLDYILQNDWFERRYLLKEFPELAACKDYSKVLEVGCGNGSTALAILRGRESMMLYACDCSNEAIVRAKEIIGAANSISDKHRFHPFQCDFSTTGFPSWLACNICSALPLDRMPKALAHCFAVIKPGGLLLFRDYGLYDMTMLRFQPDQKTGHREYLRSDGTRSYFFCLDTVRNLTSAAGFTEICRSRNLSFAVVGLTVALTTVVAYHTPFPWFHPSSFLAAMFSPQTESLLGSEKFRQRFIE